MKDDDTDALLCKAHVEAAITLLFFAEPSVFERVILPEPSKPPNWSCARRCQKMGRTVRYVRTDAWHRPGGI